MTTKKQTDGADKQQGTEDLMDEPCRRIAPVMLSGTHFSPNEWPDIHSAVAALTDGNTAMADDSQQTVRPHQCCSQHATVPPDNPKPTSAVKCIEWALSWQKCGW